MTDTLRKTWDHVAWANERVARALAEAGPDAPGEALRLFAHLVAAERIWLDRIEGGRSDHPVWPPDGARPDAHDLRERAAAQVEEARGILAEADEAALGRPVSYRASSGRPYRTALGDILLHVALHGAYHRGQVARSLRQAGLEPVNTDYITFVREG